jgi:PRTRC genetic system protein B
MTELTELTGSYEPKAALIAYVNGQNSYFESHDIKEGKFGPGKPASLDSLRALKNLFDGIDGNDSSELKGKIPKNLLYINSDKTNPILIFHTPEQNVKLHFARELQIKSKEYSIPKLLWVFHKDEISVFALRSTGLKSPVYHAPFFNVYENGKVCMGNVNISNKSEYIGSAINAITNAFFNSEFSNHIHNEKCFKEPIIDFWQNRESRWEYNHLLVRNKKLKTIEDVIDQFN